VTRIERRVAGCGQARTCYMFGPGSKGNTHARRSRQNPGRRRWRDLWQGARGRPAGEYKAPYAVAEPKPRRNRKLLDLPLHDCGPWPTGFTVRREEIYSRVRRPL